MQGTTIDSLKRLLLVSVLLSALAILALLAVTVSAARAEFGISAFDQQITADAGGDAFVQAGGHPYDITTEIDFHSSINREGGETFGLPRPDADARDVVVKLPPGLIGNPAGISECSAHQLSSGAFLAAPECPISSQVGVIQVRTTEYEVFHTSWTFPVYNMIPSPNVPAKFGFSVAGVPIFVTGNVRNSGDFGITVTSADISNTLPITGVTLTFWGTPADHSHDAQRCDWANFGFPNREEPVCPGEPGAKNGPNPDPVPPRAFLTVPVSCGAPGSGLETTLQVDSWDNPGVFVERSLVSHAAPGYPLAPTEWGLPQGFTGCEAIPFKPSITVAPTNSQADTPSGLNIDISLPQEGLLSPEGLATADVKDAVVTLPAGESVSPSAADGLGACSLDEIGLHTGLPASCPESSKLGTVEIDTPLLETPLEGSIFLAKQNENPFGSLIALYVVAEGNGVILKLPGHVDLDPVTGRITTTFDNNPQLPFDHLKLNFKAGPRSPLVNPPACGSYETTAKFSPWSGNPPAEISSSFQITSGPGGGACPGAPQAFGPSFAAGTTNNQAGAHSPLSVLFRRNDGEQQLGGLTMTMPPGLLGSLVGIPLCPEPQAAQGACSPASEIGHVTVAAGAGANPFYVNGGRVFLTGAYNGGQFGLSIAVPAIAGPFDLGTVVVRASIKLDPHTTALTIATDPLPTILDGIPLDLRVVNVSVDRANFIINPTNCNPMALRGTLTGGLGTAAAVSSTFQVTNCAALAFKPKFTVSTSGRTSRAGGASLDAKIVYPKGVEANIAKVKVDLPKQLPSRLTTLQKACAAAVFNANPANCPAASVVGSAAASTPVLPVSLSGPVYFVSNGGEAFPNLVVVLRGYGVQVNLVGDTFISKAGITSSTFNAVPDVPVSSFELKLPEGPHSALAANGNLCKSKLAMPTMFLAQDGTRINQSTKVAVTGCPKAKKKPKAKHAKK